MLLQAALRLRSLLCMLWSDGTAPWAAPHPTSLPAALRTHAAAWALGLCHL